MKIIETDFRGAPKREFKLTNGRLTPLQRRFQRTENALRSLIKAYGLAQRNR